MTFQGFNWEAWRQVFIAATSFINEFAYVLGLVLLITFGLHLKKLSDLQTTVTPTMVVSGLIASVAMLYFANSHQSVAQTIFINDLNAFDSDELSQMTGSNPYAPFLFVLAFFSVFGLGMMLKGCYLIRFAGNPRFEGQSVGGRALLHVAFGTLLYYSPAFASLMAPNLGGFNMMTMFGL